MNFMGMGAPELFVVGMIAFLLFGAKGMQDGVKGVGKVMRDLKGQSNELKKMVKDAMDEVETEVSSAMDMMPDGSMPRPTGARSAEPKARPPLPGAALAASQTGTTTTPGPAGQPAAALPAPSAAPSAAEGSKT